MMKARSHDSSRPKARGETEGAMNEDFPLPGLPSREAIDVWRVDLDQSYQRLLDFEAILSAEELRRAERLIFAQGANRFRVGRAMLRIGLGWYLAQRPGKIGLTTGWRGKPELVEHSPLHFNVTHCGGLALIAFTTIGEVGIDVEAIDRDVESLDIANSNFTRKESRMIAAAASREEQTRVFLRFWTRKEAVLKAAGGGLLHGLDSVDVSEEPPGVVELGGELGEGGASRWLVRDIEGIDGKAGTDGYAAAIAAPAGNWNMRMWAINLDEAIVRTDARFPGWR